MPLTLVSIAKTAPAIAHDSLCASPKSFDADVTYKIDKSSPPNVTQVGLCTGISIFLMREPSGETCRSDQPSHIAIHKLPSLSIVRPSGCAFASMWAVEKNSR